MREIVSIAGAVTVMLGAAGAIIGAGAWLLRVLRSVARLADDLMGEPARGLQPARPGVLDRLIKLEDLVARLVDAADQQWQALADRLAAVETELRQQLVGLEDLVARRMDVADQQWQALADRLAAVEAELRPNGGSSLRDAVDRLQPTTTEEAA